MITIKQILEKFQVIHFVGDENTAVAQPIQFIESNLDPTALMWVNDKNLEKLNNLKFGVVICSEKFTNFNNDCKYLVVKNPRYFFKSVIESFFVVKEQPSISKNSVIDATATVGKDVTIGHFVVIEANVQIGDHVKAEYGA